MLPCMYCYFATITTGKIVSIGDVVYNANWYNYSPEIQKNNILIIGRSQERLHFSGFGIIYCTLGVLQKVRSIIL